ncbi:MAG: 2-C-methyl-D-erythritol 2,4-cyclodiphosphate synthase [Spirochaetes bacterium]|nr:2-C-methyl-D-erythritol 2,4-cyclodiphosphate synthase [Spirochaetota bacterium]
MRLAVIVTAAGKGERFGAGKKEFRRLGRGTVLAAAVRPFTELEPPAFIVVTVPSGGSDAAAEALGPDLARGVRFVEGGATRRESVLHGLRELRDADPDLVLVHDGARPFVSPALIESVANAAEAHGAAVPLVPLVDTPKEVDGSGVVIRHPRRGAMKSAQTPQGFGYRALLAAHESAEADGMDCTDDAEIYARYAGPVAEVQGDPANRKITFAADLEAEGHASDPVSGARVGQGWDVHRLVPGRLLMLGGVIVPFGLGEDGHSDGDVLFHAVTDALLGAAALGDIGTHFPPDDPRWKDADSGGLFRTALGLSLAAGWEPANIDCTVILERPKLRPHVEAIRAGIAAAAGMPVSSVSVKAKTCEGLGPVGEGRAIEAHAVVLSRKF